MGQRLMLKKIGACLSFAMVVTVAFIVVAVKLGKYTAVDIYIGCVWTFALSLILSSLLILPSIQRRAKRATLS